jgi:hypothetical protein
LAIINNFTDQCEDKYIMNLRICQGRIDRHFARVAEVGTSDKVPHH